LHRGVGDGLSHIQRDGVAARVLAGWQVLPGHRRNRSELHRKQHLDIGNYERRNGIAGVAISEIRHAAWRHTDLLVVATSRASWICLGQNRGCGPKYRLRAIDRYRDRRRGGEGLGVAAVIMELPLIAARDGEVARRDARSG